MASSGHTWQVLNYHLLVTPGIFWSQLLIDVDRNVIFEYFTTLLAAGHNWQLLVTSGFIWSHHATIELPFSGHFLVTSICF
jgi:hypothetical protein